MHNMTPMSHQIVMILDHLMQDSILPKHIIPQHTKQQHCKKATLTGCACRQEQIHHTYKSLSTSLYTAILLV